MADDKEVSVETRVTTPANMLIKIESFSLLSKYGIREYESREFAAADYKWRLIIYPDGDETENHDHVSVYLSVAGIASLPVDWELNAIFTIFLYNQISDNYLCFRGKTRRFHAMNLKWGFPKLISKKMLTDPSNGYLVNDKCVLGAEVFVINSQRVIECVSVVKVTNPYKRNWKISDYSNLGGVWTSEEFAIGCLKWKIKLYPNGVGSEEERNVSIFLESVDCKIFDPHEKVKADFCISIRNTWNSSHNCSLNLSHWFTSSEPNCGKFDLIPITDMNDPKKGFLCNDCCYLEIQISLQVLVLDSDKPGRKSSILPGLHPDGSHLQSQPQLRSPNRSSFPVAAAFPVEEEPFEANLPAW